MALKEQIYPGSSSFEVGKTPFGTYDNDSTFASDAPRIANWCAKRLGYPIQNVELVDDNFFACIEEATSEYAAQVNQFNIRNDLDSLKGRPTGSNYSQQLVQGNNLAEVVGISEAYGTLAGVGGKTDIKKGSIDLQRGVQHYDLDSLFTEVSESSKKVDVTKVYFEPAPAINRSMNPYSTMGPEMEGEFPMLAQYMMTPVFDSLLRAQAIEFNEQIKRSAHSFNIVNNKLQIFPVPTRNEKLWFEYFVRDEFIQNSTNVTPDVVSDYSNVGYDFIQYSKINDVGRQWIRKYSLALAKELLGAVREKYNTIPIPGSEVSLDGAALRAEGQSEQEKLMEQLRENLEELSRKSQFESRNDQANQQQEMLRKVPLNIYIG